MVYVKQAPASTLLLALVAIVFTPNNFRTFFFIYGNIALISLNDMMQMFDNDYVALTPF